MPTNAKPSPVFPEVASTIVPPSLIKPFFSASSIIDTAILSLLLLPGLNDSILPYT